MIVFQINPETITHAWTEAAAPPPPQPKPNEPPVHVSALAVTGNPGESFSFTLMLDSDEQISDVATDPIGAALASPSGVYTRLAALELLQFPTPPPDGSLVGGVSAAAERGDAGRQRQRQLQPGRAGLAGAGGAVHLGPDAHRAGAGDRVQRQREAVRRAAQPHPCRGHHHACGADAARTWPTCPAPMAGIAQAAYNYTQGLRQVQAIANLGQVGRQHPRHAADVVL